LTIEAVIHRATIADTSIIARQRAAMFVAMGSATPDIVDQLVAEAEVYLRSAIPREEYLGWLACPAAAPEQAVAGAGVQIRRVLPFPRRLPDGRTRIAEGRQAIILNVYTEPPYRRRGLARQLMTEVLHWARSVQLESLVLHASPDGQSLYEKLGFAMSNEMRFMGDLGGFGDRLVDAETTAS
jgi:GNAT superfamily N-acetyltransferase